MYSRLAARGVRAAVVVVGLLVGALTAQMPSARPDLVFGMSTALTGPAADLGVNMLTGFESAFAEANAIGGSRGRRLRLIALDDGYEPARTAPNMRRLIEQEHVLAVVGNVGTPTAIAALPIAKEHKVPFFGAFTGAGVLRHTPPERYVVNFRASYAEETGAMVDACLEGTGLGVTEIAFFTQRDAYGDAGFAGGITALRRHGLENDALPAHGRYERNTLVVENGLAEILQHSPAIRAVIMVGAYAPCAEFIKQAVECELQAVFLNVSFVGSASLAAALGDVDAKVVVTQVVPHFAADLEIVRQYRKALALLGNAGTPNFGSLEGYIAARILIRALDASDGEVTRESIVDSLERLGRFDLGLGNKLELSPTRHQASNGVWPTILRKHEVVPFDWKDLHAMLGQASAK